MTTTSRLKFGALLRRHRLAAGLTQEGLAERAGLSARGIQDIERGVNLSPRAETIRMLADALDLDAADRAALIAAARPELLEAPSPATTQLQLPELPRVPTTLLGREHDITATCALLRRPGGTDGTRLLTLTGPGGVGKTRLALTIGAALTGDFADGVAWIDLAPVSDPALVAATLTRALGLQESGEQSANQALAAALSDRQLLLILDNMEHLLPAAPLVAEILTAAPGLAVLVTSRARLRLRGEREFPVAPLAVPAPAGNDTPSSLDELAETAAVRLFVERSAEVRPGFSLEPANAAAIAEICRRLDGLPLAIELAAAWSKILVPEALLDQLERRLPLLTGGPRDLPDRQSTMHDAIAWSYNLLADRERSMFRRLAVFTGGFTLEAAGAVHITEDSGPVPDSQDVLNLVAVLVDHSLLMPVEQSGHEPRFTLLETIREYGLEQLEACGEERAVRKAHAAYFHELARLAEPELAGPEQAAWLQRLEVEQGNLRSTLEWCTTPAGDVEMGLRLADALWSFWEMRGSLREGRRWLGDLLAIAPGRTPLRARVLTGAGALAFDQGDYYAARALHEESLSIRRELGDRRGIAVSLGNLGNVAHHQGEYAGARALHEECLAIMRDLGQQGSVAIALENLGQLALSQGDDLAARAFHEESLVISRELGDVWGIANSLNNLGEVMLYQEDYGAARLRLDEALAIMKDLRDVRNVAVVLNNLGKVAFGTGDRETARARFEESLALSREVGDRVGVAAAFTNLGMTLLDAGDHAAARAHLRDSLTIRRVMRDRPGIARALVGLAGVAVAEGQLEYGARLLGTVDTLLTAMGAVMPPGDRTGYERTVAATRNALGEDRFALVYAEGSAMALEQAVAEALKVAGSPEQP